MNQLINDVIEYGAMPIANNASKINELYGLMSGLISDEQLNNDEVFALNDWLNKNPNIIEDYPAFIIAERVRAILEDGVIDDEEKEDLTETLKQISGIRFNESGLSLIHI